MYCKPENALSFSSHFPLKEDEHAGRIEEIRTDWPERAEAPKGTTGGGDEVDGEGEIQ